MATSSTSGEVPPLGKYLVSTEKKTRDKAIKGLTAFLSEPSRNVLSRSEMAKLWKGIFYCFWMSDKPLVQQALATEISEIILTIPKASASLAFLRGFWESLVREWAGIDYLRIDKYYMLVRRFVNASFRLLIRENWENSILAEYNDILTARGGPLCVEDPRIPSELAYHLADIYLEELNKALVREADSQPSPAPLCVLAIPFFEQLAKAPNSTTVKRLQGGFLEPLIHALSDEVTEEGEAEEEPSRKRPRLDDPYDVLVANACVDSTAEGAVAKAGLRKAVLKRIFDLAGAETTRDANRRKLYAVVKSYDDDEEDS